MATNLPSKEHRPKLNFFLLTTDSNPGYLNLSYPPYHFKYLLGTIFINDSQLTAVMDSDQIVYKLELDCRHQCLPVFT